MRRNEASNAKFVCSSSTVHPRVQCPCLDQKRHAFPDIILSISIPLIVIIILIVYSRPKLIITTPA